MWINSNQNVQELLADKIDTVPHNTEQFNKNKWKHNNHALMPIQSTHI